MANSVKTTAFTSTSSKNETPLDKTTRIARRIIKDESEIRHQKAARLRKVRFEGGTEKNANI